MNVHPSPDPRLMGRFDWSNHDANPVTLQLALSISFITAEVWSYADFCPL
jgi:hypothetical protein